MKRKAKKTIENKLKFNTFIIPLITLFLYYMGVVILNNSALGSKHDWMKYFSFIVFLIFMLTLILFATKMIFSSFKTLKMKNLGGFSKLLRLIFSLSLITISIAFATLTIILISLVFSRFGASDLSDLNLAGKFEYISLAIINETTGLTLDENIISGLAPTFWIMFGLAMLWAGGGLITVILTRPKNQRKSKINN